MIREAGPADRAALDAFLVKHAESAMFLLGNLREYGVGVGDFPLSHPNATRFWWVGAGVIGVTQAGMLLPLLPEFAGFPGVRAQFGGASIAGAVGPMAQVRWLVSELGLVGRPVRVDKDEPGFRLDLGDLRVPVAEGAELITPGAAERDLMLGWRWAYLVEIMGENDAEAARKAAGDIDDYLARGSHRVLLRDGVPVAMTGFNAALPEIVQIGGVYTPPDLRGHGHARLAVALHLAQARAAGVARAVLFAASDAAARAYRAIGFRASDPVTLVLFDGMQRVE